MGRLIKIHDIDEFSEVKNIPPTSIGGTILSNIRSLNEKRELEPFVREILYDPNQTTHGPTEIADILTTHMHVRGDRRMGAFVLKGKSLSRVSSKDVTHQFAKLRQIPELGVMVFGAVGNIQDDAQRDFIQTAIDAGCDYLVVDAHDWARLLIAYEKICPQDGTPYNETGICRAGHQRDKGLTLQMEVGERIRYTITNQQDASHAGAKRYGAMILLDRHYPRDVIRAIIQEATDKLKRSNYYRNERVKARWGKTPAHVIWLYIAYDPEDIRNANWVCRTCWIDPSLRQDMRPHRLNGNEKLRDIEVLWNDDYEAYKDFFESHQGTKEEFLEAICPILNEVLKLAKQVIDHFEKYQRGDISKDKFILRMLKMEPRATELCRRSENIPIAPEDCADYDRACHSIFATVDNMFLYYSKRGLERWSESNRNWLMQEEIRRFDEDRKTIELEESKLH